MDSSNDAGWDRLGDGWQSFYRDSIVSHSYDYNYRLRYGYKKTYPKNEMQTISFPPMTQYVYGIVFVVGKEHKLVYYY